MTLTISLSNPLNGARQVPSDQSLEIAIDTSSPLEEPSLKVLVNGQKAFLDRTSHSPTDLIEGFRTSNSTDLNLKNLVQFQLGEKIDILSLDGIFEDIIKSQGKDGYSASVSQAFTSTQLRSLETEIVQQINERTIKVQDAASLDPSLLGFQPTIRIVNESKSIELLRKVVSVSGSDLILDLAFSFSDATSVVFQPQIRSRDRGFQGQLSGLSLLLAPLNGFQSNKVYFITVECRNQDNEQARAVFNFRTQDKKPPQILDLKSTIENSEIQFKLVDLLDNPIVSESLNIWLNEERAIVNGQPEENFTGQVLKITDSLLNVFIRPHHRFDNQQSVNLRLEVLDGYGNLAREIKTLKNITSPIAIELVEVLPKEDSVLDPELHPISLRLRTPTDLSRRSVNISYKVDEISRDEIVRGEFVSVCTICQDQVNEIGEVRISSSELFIFLANIRGVLYNSTLALELKLQEADENGELIGEPFFQKTFHFSTVSSIFGPIIDKFIPDLTKPISRSTKIGFRAISLTNLSPINKQSLTVSVNNELAIDEGNFVNNYTGLIKEAQNSGGNSLLVEIIPPNFFEVGAIIPVEILVQDQAGNQTNKSYSLSIVNTQSPTLSFSPPPGVYTTIQRITLTSNQPAQIYYTIDGSVPQIGQLGTFIGTDVVANLPIFIDGITQIKAFAVNQSGSTSSVVTALYDLNTTAPQIEILSPQNQTLVEDGFVKVNYKITLKRGYLVKVEWRLNNGIKNSLENTIPESECLITGLIAGDNLIEIFATDNYQNLGTVKLQVRVPSSSLSLLRLNYAPLRCPVFSQRTAPLNQGLTSVLDVETIAIIGYGKRREQLVDFALGDGKDGEPLDFVIGNQKDGRHFKLKSFPTKNLDLFLTRKGRTKTIDPKDYVLSQSTGELVLDHPLEVGESLEANYISESDLNSPSLFLQPEQAYEKHGFPSLENSLSLAAQMAFENGARRILAIQPSSNDNGWKEALRRLETEECYFILPILSDSMIDRSQIIGNCYQHVVKMSNIKYRKERVLVLPFEENLPANPRVRALELDNNQSLRRVLNGELQVLEKVFANAAYLGKEAGLPTASTMTKKTISGFSFPVKKKSPRLDLEAKLNQGITSLVPLLDGAQIFQARTTSNQGSAILEEPSIQRIQDYVSKFLRKTLEDQFVGFPITSTLLKEIEKVGNQFLANSKDIISSGQITGLVQRIDEPRQVDLQVSFSPLFPLNQITVTFNLLTSF